VLRFRVECDHVGYHPCAGDLFMSLIYTCQLNQANPFDYLTELQRQIDELAVHPERWMPWNYREAWPER
jgi:hypothetical protein